MLLGDYDKEVSLPGLSLESIQAMKQNEGHSSQWLEAGG